ncbi:hypothetical protein AB4Z09_18170 [Rhodococcus sp. TAF43]|uniref:hypothetical protein n=1 Tax=Rhodococcus sp. TAF43 TaxID=3237483 RepID=UPI003F96C86F
MTATTRNLLAGLAAVAVVLVVGGLVFDRRETRAYSQCLAENRMIVSGTYNVPEVPYTPPDPATEWIEFDLSGCEDANRAGLIMAGIGGVMLVATAVRWWAQRRSAASQRELG